MIDLRHLTQLACHARLWVGLSGGLDSMVLLHALSREPTLVSKLYAVHVHHGLSPEADAWLAHCEQVCAAFTIPLVIQHAHLDPKQSILIDSIIIIKNNCYFRKLSIIYLMTV